MRKGEVLNISAVQMRFLKEMIEIGKIGNRISRRLQVIVLSGEGHSGYRINKMLGLHSGCVAEWKKRWRENSSVLDVMEQAYESNEITEKELKACILGILSDQSRSGTPSRISMDQKNQIVALACEKPEKYGIPFTHWTLEMLSKVAVETLMVHSITAAYVGVILRKKNFSPIKQVTGYFPK